MADDGFPDSSALFVDPRRIVLDERPYCFFEFVTAKLGELKHVEPPVLDHFAHSWPIRRVETRRLGDWHLETREHLRAHLNGMRRIVVWCFGVNCNTVSHGELDVGFISHRIATR